MPDQEPKAGASIGSGAAASGTPGESAAAESVSRADLQALETRVLETVNKAVEGLAPRLKQSQRDVIDSKVKASVREQLQGFDAAAEALKPHLKDGVDPAAIKRNMALQLFMDQISGDSDEAVDAPQGQTAGLGQSPNPLASEIQSMLTDRGLTGKEPELVEFLGKVQGKKPYQIISELNTLTTELAERDKPDASKILSGGSGGNLPAPDHKAEYVKEMLAARGKGAAEGRVIRAKYKRLGVDVDTIPVTPVISLAS